MTTHHIFCYGCNLVQQTNAGSKRKQDIWFDGIDRRKLILIMNCYSVHRLRAWTGLGTVGSWTDIFAEDCNSFLSAFSRLDLWVVSEVGNHRTPMTREREWRSRKPTDDRLQVSCVCNCVVLLPLSCSFVVCLWRIAIHSGAGAVLIFTVRAVSRSPPPYCFWDVSWWYLLVIPECPPWCQLFEWY